MLIGSLSQNKNFHSFNQPNVDIPVYEVKREGSRHRTRTLHRNLLLPFMSTTDVRNDPSVEVGNTDKQKTYVIPQRRPSDDPGCSPPSVRRKRTKKKPDRYGH